MILILLGRHWQGQIVIMWLQNVSTIMWARCPGHDHGIMRVLGWQNFEDWWYIPLIQFHSNWTIIMWLFLNKNYLYWVSWWRRCHSLQWLLYTIKWQWIISTRFFSKCVKWKKKTTLLSYVIRERNSKTNYNNVSNTFLTTETLEYAVYNAC